MPQRTINTSLVDREEVMKFLAVAEATRLPALLKGAPGTGKTKSLLDYGKAVYEQDSEQMLKHTFILETDEGTRSGDVKGRVDMKELLLNQSYKLDSPIVDARFVLINEIDKANAGLRNSLLGIMNEGFLFNGKEKVPCKWEVFVASCNEIPSDEIGSPFWDRFVLKMEVQRISKSAMATFYADQMEHKTNIQDINVPTQQEMDAVVFNSDHLIKVIDVCHAKLSDRTLGYIPKIASAVSLVYKLNPARALVKTVALLVDATVAKQLSQSLEPKDIIEIRSKLELIAGITDKTSLSVTMQDLQAKITNAAERGIADQEMVREFKSDLNDALRKSGMIKILSADAQAELAKAAAGLTV